MIIDGEKLNRLVGNLENKDGDCVLFCPIQPTKLFCMDNKARGYGRIPLNRQHNRRIDLCMGIDVFVCVTE